jgi:apolipoprotein N-acyltransferase
MDAITDFISAHPAIFGMGIALIILLFLHFTFKSMVKLFVIILIIFLVIFGFYSFKDKDTMNDEINGSTKMTQSVIDEIKYKLSHMKDDMKDLYRKSKAAPKEVDKLLDSSDKEVDKEFKKK